MGENLKGTPAVDGQESEKKSKKGKIALIVLLALLLIGAAVATLYATGVIGGGKKEVAENTDSTDKSKDKDKIAEQKKKDEADAGAGVSDEATLRRLLAAPYDLDIQVTGDIEIKSGMPVNATKKLTGPATIRASYDMLGDKVAMLDISKRSSLTTDQVNLNGGGVANGVHVGIRAKFTYTGGRMDDMGKCAVEAEGEANLYETTTVSRVCDAAVHVLQDGNVTVHGGRYEDSGNTLIDVEKGGICTVEGDAVFDGANRNLAQNCGELVIHGGTFKNAGFSGIGNKAKLTMEYRGKAKNGKILVSDVTYRGINSAGSKQTLTLKGVEIRNTGSYPILSNWTLGAGTTGGARAIVENCVIDNEYGKIRDIYGGGTNMSIFRGKNTIKNVTFKHLTGMALDIENNSVTTLKNITFDGCYGGLDIRDSQVTGSGIRVINVPEKANNRGLSIDWGTQNDGYKEVPSIVELSDVYIEDGMDRAAYVRGKGTKATLTDSYFGRSKNYTFVCEVGAKLTLKNSTVMPCGKDQSIRAYDNADVTVENGTKIIGGTDKQAVGIWGSRFTMNGGEITGLTGRTHVVAVGRYTDKNKKNYDSTFIMNGGRIHDNNTSDVTVRVNNGSSMYMYGGVIDQNKANQGGGVWVQSGGTFEMNGGSIRDNVTTASGAGVWVQGTARMNGGEIKDNVSGSYGGGMNIVSSGRFTMSGGVISGNSCKINGGGIIISDSPASATFTGGEIRDNTAGTYGDGVMVQGNLNISGDFHMANDMIHLNITPPKNHIHVKGNSLKRHDGSDPLYVTFARGYAKLSDGKPREIVECDSDSAAGALIESGTVQCGSGAYVDTFVQDENKLVLGDYNTPDMDPTRGWDSVNVSEFWKLKKEVESTTDKKEIVLTSDIPMEDIINVPEGVTVLIKDDGSTKELTRYEGDLKAYFDVSYGTGFMMEGTAPGNLVLDGESGGENTGRFVTTKGTTDFKNVTFKNNRLSGNGGAILNYGPMTVENCEFTGNTVDTNGGAISIEPIDDLKGSEITIKDSLFDGNQTTGNCGGAVFNAGLKLKTTGTLFKNNESVHQGGAFYQNNAAAVSDFDKCIFKSNNSGTTGFGGGAIMLNAGELSVTDTAFDANSDKGGNSGGAVAVQNAKVTIENKKADEAEATVEAGIEGIKETATIAFTENKANKNDNTLGGGAISVRPLNGKGSAGSTVKVTGYTFESNTAAKGTGGAIFCDAPTGFGGKGSALTLTDCTFKTNSATNGGAVTVSTATDIDEENAVSVTDCTFDGNYASWNGGAISVGYNQRVTVENSLFTGNHADGNCGGAIQNSGGATLDIAGSSFIGNYSNNQAGAVYQHEEGALSIKESYFKDNIGSKNGGWGGGAVAVRRGTLDVTDCAFDGNSHEHGGHGGGAVLLGYQTKADNETAPAPVVTFKQTKDKITVPGEGSEQVEADVGFFNNDSKINNGGSISALNETKLTVTGYTFDTNTAATSGGAIYTESKSAEGVTLKDCAFKTNSATASDGGAIMAKGSVTCSGCTFNGNSTTKSGGAIFAEGAVKLDGECEFEANHADLQGGAIYNKNAASVFSDSKFNENDTGAQGGAVYTASALQISGCDFTENHVPNNGGAVAMSGGGKVGISTSSFVGNKSTGNCGGAILNGGATLTVESSYFTQNTAVNQAGGLYQNDANAASTFKKCVFEGNEASTKAGFGGAAIMLNNGTLTVEDTAFVDNTSSTGSTQGSGGAVSIQNATATFTATGEGQIEAGSEANKGSANVGFYGNSVTDKSTGGGAIAIRYKDGGTDTSTASTVRITGYTFGADGEPNTALAGGAILCEVAEGKGGGSALTLDGCKFNYNTASKNDGGAIMTKGKMTLTDCTFTENTSAANGGAVAIDIAAALADGQNAVSMTGCTFDTNTGTNGVGGAISCTAPAPAKKDGTEGKALYLDGCTFNTNYAGNNAGGAIYANGVTYIKGSKFSENHSSHNGGAVSIGYNQHVSVEKSVFTENYVGDNCGGAIQNSNGSKLDITGSSFIGNHTINQGGAVYQQEEGALTISESYFKENIASENSGWGGGAVAVRRGTLDVTDCAFDGNSHEHGGHGGGAVLLGYQDESSNVPAPKATFNQTEGKTEITVPGIEGSVKIGFFNNNSKINSGGAISVLNNTTISITGYTFEGNSAKLNGGAIHIDKKSAEEVTLDKCTFKNNSALPSGAEAEANNGGGAVRSNVALNVTGCTFDGNSSNRSGGAIYVKENAALTVSGSVFTQNQCAKATGANGGAIDCPGAEGEVNISDSVFKTNSSAQNCGGALSAARKSFNVTGCLFIDNQSRNQGGVFYQNGAAGVATFEKCIFKENKAGVDLGNGSSGWGGGAIMLNAGTLKVTNCAFDGNIANVAKSSGPNGGGAIMIQNATANITDDGSVEGGQLTIKDTTVTETGKQDVTAKVGFVGNTANNKNGGAISILAKDSTDANPSPSATAGSTVVITGYTFETNSTIGGGDGGAIYCVAPTGVNNNASVKPLTLSGCTFKGNKAASNKGNAIAIRGAANLVGKDTCTFEPADDQTVYDLAAGANTARSASKTKVSAKSAKKK